MDTVHQAYIRQQDSLIKRKSVTLITIKSVRNETKIVSVNHGRNDPM